MLQTVKYISTIHTAIRLSSILLTVNSIQNCGNINYMKYQHQTLTSKRTEPDCVTITTNITIKDVENKLHINGAENSENDWNYQYMEKI